MFKRVAMTMFRSTACRFVMAASILLPFSFKASPAVACGVEPMIGTMCVFAGNFAPRGYAFAEGQLLPISSNTALFSILGNTYGGDGRTTFALPDMRGRVLVGTGTGPGLSNYRVGQKGGQESVTLTQNQLPSHGHTATATLIGTNENGNATQPEGAILGHDDRDNNYYLGTPATTVNLSPDAVSVSVSDTGGSQSVTNLQPYISVHWIIALQGLYPSRN